LLTVYRNRGSNCIIPKYDQRRIAVQEDIQADFAAPGIEIGDGVSEMVGVSGDS
jgi:hypothetical protein